MAVRSGQTFQTVKDLEGLNLGTVEGYVWVKSIQEVPGATLHAYPDGNGVLDDLGAGRVDVGFLDPLIIIAAQQARPELQITTQYLTPPTEDEVQAHPAYDYFRPYMTSFYLPKQATALEAAISTEIRAMYTSGEMTALVTEVRRRPRPVPQAEPVDGGLAPGRRPPRRLDPADDLTCRTRAARRIDVPGALVGLHRRAVGRVAEHALVHGGGLRRCGRARPRGRAACG